jgi:hypothetical protein
LFAEKTSLSAAYLCAAAAMGVLLVIYLCHLAVQRGFLGIEPVAEED